MLGAVGYPAPRSSVPVLLFLKSGAFLGEKCLLISPFAVSSQQFIPRGSFRVLIDSAMITQF